eukprot:CAMPEP_0202956570 /NCGR_PEP_ID=MMETSP1396-20130829/1073_1 /ASSEMBLY_ACC=CAM_ASM_000872 /TAXON_ID= /ORGANISM="Pseudokeronopsis sp., Strain Brazil" /LENGTH=228 /DNA_ID=CAMNT_0049673651 /DNA_START=146 /DNA_END=832 /DNA_ORIENTATION=+
MTITQLDKLLNQWMGDHSKARSWWLNRPRGGAGEGLLRVTSAGTAESTGTGQTSAATDGAPTAKTAFAKKVAATNVASEATSRETAQREGRQVAQGAESHHQVLIQGSTGAESTGDIQGNRATAVSNLIDLGLGSRSGTKSEGVAAARTQGEGGLGLGRSLAEVSLRVVVKNIARSPEKRTKLFTNNRTGRHKLHLMIKETFPWTTDKPLKATMARQDRTKNETLDFV